jgi:hypothetical protein
MMRSILFIVLTFVTCAVTAQEYNVFEFGRGLPTLKVDGNSIYSFNSFGVRADFPSSRFESVDVNTTHLFKTNRFGVESDIPVIIQKVEPLFIRKTPEEILKNNKRNAELWKRN